MKIVQAHIIYTGHVQGVGFRYTTVNFAKQLNLVGWVRNLFSGKVEIQVEGEESAIKELCEKLEDNFGAMIRDKKIIMEPLSGRSQYNSFEVSF